MKQTTPLSLHSEKHVNKTTWEEHIKGTIGHGISREVEVEEVIKTVKSELQLQRREMAKEINVQLSMVLLGITSSLIEAGLSKEKTKDCLSNIKIEFDDIIKKVGEHD